VSAAIPSSADAPTTPEASGTRAGNAYAHLTDLFTELARLSPDDPRRSSLRDHLITGYLPVARNIAHRFAHRGDSVDDLEQVATLGLIGAIDRFDPARGIDFLSFAVPTITGEVRRHFRDRVRTIRIPRKISQLQGAVHECTAELTQLLGRAPRPSELAERIGVSLEDIIEVLQAHHTAYPASLDEPGPDDERPGRAWATSLGDVDPGIDLVDDRMAVVPLLADLPERERRILQLRFFQDMTQTEIAALTGISQMHVSRLLSRTLALLRSQLAVEA
jgi:RNA polymerase sigma-B factor